MSSNLLLEGPRFAFSFKQKSHFSSQQMNRDIISRQTDLMQHRTSSLCT